MNYVKIIAKSPYLDYKLFVKENQTGKVLNRLQELHSNTPASNGRNYDAYKGWLNDNFLSVTMRRVIVPNKKADMKTVIERSLKQINLF